MTPQQRRFCLEYLKDRNGKQAAIRAGYARESAGISAWKVLRLTEVRVAIRTLIADQESRLKADADRVLKELIRIGFFDASILQRVCDGSIQLEELTFDERAAVAEFTKTVTESVDAEGNPVIRTVTKAKSHPKTPALNILAKHFNLFKDIDLSELKDVFELNYKLEKK